uniref:Uncharacterized protein n=1 Tax=Anguilla anguilla TaxID=7936 RepID=A0A0E9Q0I8_ANGAN
MFEWPVCIYRNTEVAQICRFQLAPLSSVFMVSYCTFEKSISCTFLRTC